MAAPRTNQKPRQKPRTDWLYIIVHAGMLVSLGAIVATGMKKMRGPHIAASAAFGGFALTHAVNHHTMFARRMKQILKRSAKESPTTVPPRRRERAPAHDVPRRVPHTTPGAPPPRGDRPRSLPEPTLTTPESSGSPGTRSSLLHR